MHHRRFCLSITAALLIAFGLSIPAPAQQVLVQNGATAQVSNGGAWHLQGATMDFGEVGATARLDEKGKGRVFGGLLTATRALNGPTEVDVAGLGAELSASVDLGEVTVTRGHTVQTDGSGSASIRRYYDLSATGTNSGLDATLTQHYKDGELNSLDESNLEMFKSTDGGSTWSEEGVDKRDASANTVTLSGIRSFSRWTLGSESDPLPVELAGFEANRTETAGSEAAVRLTWQVASETGNAGFEVQRRAKASSEKRAWQKIGFVDSKAEGGTTSEARTYRFADEGLPYAADTLEYRLRQVDLDGTTAAYDPVIVAREGPAALRLEKTAPNPARSQVRVRYAVPEAEASAEAVRLRLYDVLGRAVRTVVGRADAGRHETRLSVDGLASGVYLLRLSAGDATGPATTRRLTVVR